MSTSKYDVGGVQLSATEQDLTEVFASCDGKSTSLNIPCKKKKSSFTGLTCDEIMNSTEAQMVVVSKNGKSLSFFTYPALNKTSQAIAIVLGSELLGTHIRTCRQMFMSNMKNMITKKEAYCMEYFRKPLKRLTETDLKTSFEGV